MDGLRQMQLSLFALAVGAIRERDAQALALAQARSSSARRVATVAGDLGDQLAMALWHGEQLALAVEKHACTSCTTRLGSFLLTYRRAVGQPVHQTARWLPFRGYV
jgi:hypothetical protein